MLFFWKLVNITSYKSVAPVTVPRPINNLFNKLVKAHAVCKFLINTNFLPRVIEICLEFLVETL